MAWYYVLNGASHGPVAETDILTLRAQNVVTPDTPIWTEGMTEWVPFSNSKLATGLAAAPSPPGSTHTCVECGRLFPEGEMLNYEGAWVCAACKPVFFQRIKEGVVPRGNLVYGGFLRRLAAIFIDGIIIDIVVLPLIFVLGGFNGLLHKNIDPGMSAIIYLIQYLIPAAYEIGLIAMYGATFGKMLLKIRVVTPEGGRISFARSTGRYFAKMISGIVLCIGYFMIIWDEEKRGLHDRICKTRVVVDSEI